jgi:hypothetical protein
VLGQLRVSVTWTSAGWRGSSSRAHGAITGPAT